MIIILLLLICKTGYSQYQQYEKPDLIDIDTFYKNKKGRLLNAISLSETIFFLLVVM